MFIKYQLYPKNWLKTFEIMPNLVTLITLFWTKHLSTKTKLCNYVYLFTVEGKKPMNLPRQFQCFKRLFPKL